MQAELESAYEKANRGAKRGRLRRKDQYAILEYAYRRARSWERDRLIRSVASILIGRFDAIIGRSSSFFLLLLRASIPGLEPKRASKWAAALESADYHQISRKRLIRYLEKNGGIEGAAGERARLQKSGKLRD